MFDRDQLELRKRRLEVELAKKPVDLAQPTSMLSRHSIVSDFIQIRLLVIILTIESWKSEECC